MQENENKKRRDIKNNRIIVRISYQTNVLGNMVDKEGDLDLYKKEDLESAYNRFQTRNNIKNANNNNYFYVKSENRIKLLDKNQTVENLDLKSGDKILVSSRNQKHRNIKNTNNINNTDNIENNNRNTTNLYNIKNNNIMNVDNNKDKKKKLKKTIIISSVAFIIIILGISLLIFFLLRKKKKQEEKEIEYEEEQLVTKINYIENIIYRYKSNKNTNLQIDTKNNSNNNSEENIIQYIDFIFLLRKSHFEIENNKTKKNWFTGYISILNMTINNGTKDMMIFYDKNLNNYINVYYPNNSNNELDENIVLDYTGENDTNCFIKIDFYENGEIKNIFIPEIFSLSNMMYINNIIKLIIPKLSPNLYVDNITNKVEEILNNGSKIDSEEEDEYEDDYEDEFEDDEEELNGLDDEEEEDNNDKDIEKDSRRLNEDNSYNNNLNSQDDLNFENNLLNQSSDSNIIDLRGISNIIDNDQNITNLTQFTLQELESEEMKLKNSELNTVIYSKIDEKGILFSVKEIQNSFISQPENNNNEIDEEYEKIKSSIYTEDNQISMDEANFENEIKSNFTVDLNIIIESINDLTLIDRYNTEQLTRELYNYFDKFTYKVYNDKNYKENNLRVLYAKEEDLDKERNKQDSELENLINEYSETLKLRKLESQNTYYGLKAFTYEKEFYKFNIIGLKLQGLAVCKIEPSTGIVSNYFDMYFGKICFTFKLAQQQTNLHIILDRMNKMTFNFITLLIKSNKELIENNIYYGNIIVNIEKNISQLYKEYFDYSGIYREFLDDMYNQICNFTGNFFDELIELISITHDNYTLILSEAKDNSYETINKIRIITKNSYINYINNMSKILSFFEIQTMIFLNNIEKEIKSINIIQIDILYDIIDLIYDGKMIIKAFNKNLFKAIERGITTFKYSINEYIENIIGDLLYVTDFLSININKNEILMKVINEQNRIITTQKLKDFRNIIIIIMDILINNIYDDYEGEISLNNNKSIKYYIEKRVEEYNYNIEEKSNNITEYIKSKIKFINLYEKYSNNINIMNNIYKKINEEFKNDIYINIINISRFSPEYTNQDSNIVLNKNKLFEITKEITNNINLEIQKINNDAILNSKKYIQQNYYNLHYNLYNFRKYFLKDNILKLVYDYNKIIEEILKINYISIIDSNYELAYQYLLREHRFYSYITKGDTYIGSGFVERYHKLMNDFKDFMVLSYSDEFYNKIENYFYKIKNDILNYINNKMLSINKYNFNNEFRDSNFYFVEQIYNEIYNIINNLDNYFNEEIFNSIIRINALNIATDIIRPYDEKKEKMLNDYYKIITNTFGDRIYGANEDFILITRRKKRNKWLFWKYKIIVTVRRYNCKNQNNINKITKNLASIDIDIKNSVIELIKNFTSTIDFYLDNYISISQTLYNNRNNFYNNKINDHSNIIKILNKYETLLNNMLINDTNNNLLERLSNKIYKITKINDYLNGLEKNINEIEEIYYKLNYLEDHNDFLEYPEEIQFKINQFKSELPFITTKLKNKINLPLRKKIINIIKSTNYFIRNIHNFNFKYIITNLNISKGNEIYYSIKTNLINDYFNNYTKKIDEKSTQFNENQSINNSISIYENNQDDYINKIIKYYTDFVIKFENKITEHFCVEKCKTNITDNSFIDENGITRENISNQTICWKERKKSNLDYSKYNFNIVKLRKEIYFSKELLANIDSLFDDLNYNNDIISPNKINTYDILLNDKNILDIYNETKYKLEEFQNENLYLLEGPYDIFLQEIKSNYPIENEILIFYNKFENILKNKDSNFNHKITENFEKISNNINSLLIKFNQTLYKQIELKNNYDYYNINKNNYTSIYTYYYSLIHDCFEKYKNKTISLKSNYLFYYSLQHILNILQSNKRKLYRNDIDYFLENNKYNFEFYSLYYDLGKILSNSLEKEYLNYNFELIYKYYEIFGNYSDILAQNITKDISKIENNVEEKLKSIYDEFINSFEKTTKSFINYDYINQLKENHSECNLLSNLELNKVIKEDLINSNFSLELVDNILDNCSFVKSSLNFIDKNNNNFVCLNITDLNLKINFTKTKKKLFDCEKNFYYNYSVIMFEDFNISYKIILDNIINDIIQEIELNYIDGKFLNNYLENNYEIDSLINFEIDDFYINIEDIYEIILYINRAKDSDYTKFLVNNLIKSFNISYEHFVDNFLIDEIIENTTKFISNKLELYIDYIKERITNEYDYFLFLLNNTEEISISSNTALNNLFINYKNKINEYLNNSIEDEIYFYFDIFSKENKNIFTKNYINYFYKNLNEYNIDIYKIKNYLEEIIIDKNFNKTLETYSNNIINNIIIKIKSEINNIFNEEMISLNNILNNYLSDIEEILNQKTINNTNEETTIIYELIYEYDNLTKNQNNKFTFIVGDEPFIFINNLIQEKLSPPLMLVKEFYNSIEENFLNKVTSISDNFPDLLPLIKDDLIEKKIDKIYQYTDDIYSSILEYKNRISNDIDSYVNEKLIYYTYINGLNTFEIKEVRDLNENDSNNANDNYTDFINITKNNKRKINYINFKRKLKGYDYTMSSLKKDDMIPYLNDIQNNILKFNKSFIGEEFIDIENYARKFLIKVNDTYLDKLKTTFSMKLYKFSSILTDENLEELKKSLFKQYYQIEQYIHEKSDFITEQVDNFTKIINNTSELLPILSELIYNKAIINYDFLTKSIQNKYAVIDISTFKKSDELKNKEDSECYSGIRNIFLELDKSLIDDIKNIFSGFFNFNFASKSTKFSELLGNIFSNIKNIGSKINDILNFFDKDFYKFKKTLVEIPLPILPILSLKIAPYVYLGSGLDKSLIKDNTIGIGLDLYVRGEIGIDVSFGLDIPEGESPFKLTAVVGIKGILASGRVGIKLNLYLIAEQYEIDLYIKLNALSFQFYVLFSISIKVWKFKFGFEYYIVNFIFTAFSFEKHKTKLYELKFQIMKEKLLLQDYIKNIFSEENLQSLI